MLAACQSTSPGPSASPAADATGSGATPTLEAPVTESPAPAVAAWLLEPLQDVRTGATVRLNDLHGRIVFVEAMATWCPPCHQQQHEALLALANLDRAKVTYVSVDVDPQESEDTIDEYAELHGFDWQFFVATPAFLRELADAFGPTVLSPPATTIVLLDPAGEPRLTEEGIKPAERLVELARDLGA
jgi:thiol-disulfide isomerase/thioredoxin